jgi:4a-hydroxytetrahydrobiopterin dehydratase
MSATALETLAQQACVRDATRLPAGEVDTLLAVLPGWQHVADRVAKTYRFAGWHETMAFVNAVAWIAERAGHHPDLSVHFNRCVVSYSTHDAGGITRNDFVCAARVERLFA